MESGAQFLKVTCLFLPHALCAACSTPSQIIGIVPFTNKYSSM